MPKAGQAMWFRPSLPAILVAQGIEQLGEAPETQRALRIKRTPQGFTKLSGNIGVVAFGTPVFKLFKIRMAAQPVGRHDVRQLAGQQPISGGSQGVLVAPPADIAIQGILGSTVLGQSRLTGKLTRTAMAIQITHVARAEVGEYQLAMGVDQDIVRMNTLVQYIAVVQRLNRLAQLHGKVQALGKA